MQRERGMSRRQLRLYRNSFKPPLGQCDAYNIILSVLVGRAIYYDNYYNNVDVRGIVPGIVCFIIGGGE